MTSGMIGIEPPKQPPKEPSNDEKIIEALKMLTLKAEKEVARGGGEGFKLDGDTLKKSLENQ